MERKKNKENIRRRGVSFEEAQTDNVFDPLAKVAPDPDHSSIESRFLAIGHSTMQRVLLVVHCFRANDTNIRIISARKVTRTEREEYEEGL